jgi:hypothetical protein
VHEGKGLCTKQDIYDIITEFFRKNPRASVPETVFPEPYKRHGPPRLPQAARGSCQIPS